MQLNNKLAEAAKEFSQKQKYRDTKNERNAQDRWTDSNIWQEAFQKERVRDKAWEHYNQ